jgi:pimeloyl-ACP methyl ester carboxylesterase
MQIIKNYILERAEKKSILIDIFYSENKANQPTIIFCHGYKGFKDWGAWNIMAKKIAKSGCCFIKFNFSHNGGTMKNPIDFPDLESFGQNNYTKELDDLNDVIDWSRSYFKNKSFVSIDNICLIGHSRGGGIVTIKAEEDSRITNVISLAGVCDFGKRTATIGDLKQWENEGVQYVLNGRTKQKMPHYYQFFENFQQNENRLNIKRASSNLKIPHLIIHGDNDSSVSINEAKNLHKWNPKSKLKIIEGANHVFNTKHPWKKNALPRDLEIVIREIQQFLNS